MSVLVLGGSSAIGREVAREFAKRKYDLYLAGRDLEEVETIAQDLRIRYNVSVLTGYFDATSFESHAAFLDSAMKQMPSIDHVLLAFGYLGVEPARYDFDDSKRVVDTNFLGAVSILTHVARKFEEMKRGNIIVISSVAGDRGRRRNYVYGSSKAGLSTFTQGLRSQLKNAGVHVLTVKPGVVDTPMAEGASVPRLLVASPERVARDIVNATRSRRDVIYSPWYWKIIMFVIRALPEGLFKNSNL